MLELYFSSPTRLKQLRRGPLASHLDRLAVELRQAGYPHGTGASILSFAGQFNAYLYQHRLEISAIDEALGHRFIEEELKAVGAYKGVYNMLWHLLGYLRRQGLIAPLLDATEIMTPIDELLIQYRQHLQQVRGLTENSCTSYVRLARRFLAWHVDRHQGLAVGHIDGPEILEYVSYACALFPDSRSWPNHVTSSTRSVLRFLRWQQLIAHDLDRVVPPIPKYRLSNVPKHLPWQQIRTVIDSVDAVTTVGKRDKAILLVLAVLGLRNHDVVTLELTHIDWHHGLIRLPQTKSRRERVLPMPQEVGDAIADYVLHGRPPLATPYVFVRHRAPFGPLEAPINVSTIAYKHLKRAGVRATVSGSAHLFRFSLATHLVNHGTPIKEIADMLGHASIDTTAIYTKVDVTHLADVALPLPEVSHD
jgi:integrase/recombinase XerD